MSIVTRALNPAELKELAAAQLVAITTAPYFAMALWRVQPVAAEGLGTFAVDDRWRLYLDPAQLHAWGPTLAGGVLVHEVGHLLRQHGERGRALGASRSHSTWNLATDAAINADIIAAGIELPQGAVTPQLLGLPVGGIEEEYYAALPQQGDPNDDQGCGSGAGDPGAEWELAPGDSTAPGLPGPIRDLTRTQVAQATLTASPGSGRGTAPAGIRRWAERLLAPPQVNWKVTLRSQVRRAITFTREGQSDYTYTRPGRRAIPRVISPSMHTPKVTVAVVVDTSGSMSQDDVAAALTEVEGIVAATRSTITVLSVDTEVTVTKGVKNPRSVDLSGGGGTDMREGITTAQHQRPRPDVIVVLTDGYTPWPAQPTRERLIIGLISTHPVPTPSWAVTVLIIP